MKKLDKEQREKIEKNWNKHSGNILKICEIRCKNHEDAKDLCQRVALKYCENAESMLNQENAFPWLYTVAKRSFFNYVADNKILYFPSADFSNVSEEHGTHYTSNKMQDENFLYNLSADLAPVEKMILDMQYNGGVPVHQISPMLGLTTNAIHKRRKRALEKMKEKLSSFTFRKAA